MRSNFAKSRLYCTSRGCIRVSQAKELFFKMIQIVLILLLLTTLCGCATASSAPFSYDHQDRWSDAICHSGTFQSPVNIRTEDLRRDSRTQNLFLDYPPLLSGSVMNNGHAVQFTPDSYQQTGYINTHLGKYRLLQMHMHWGENNGVGSEHRINGEQASLEIHFVHESVSGYGHVVIAVMADAGSESDSSIFNKFPLRDIMNYNAIRTIYSLQIHQFFPADRSYYYYEGSLTTPGCDQTVNWFILKDRIIVPRSFLVQLRKLKDSHGNKLEFNYRDPQQLYCRKVYEHEDRVQQCPFNG